MIRIVLKESAAKVSTFDYGLKHIRFLKRIGELASAVANAANEFVGEEEEPLPGAIETEAQTAVWLEIIYQIKPLRSEHIRKAIGFGARGGAFLLTNGNILKVGLEHDDESGEEALKIPNKLTGAQFGGKGSPGELHVYDSGVFGVEGSEHHWAWREVPAYTTFMDWAKVNLPNTSEYTLWTLSTISSEITKIVALYSSQLDKIPDFTTVFKYFMKKYAKSYNLIGQLGVENSSKLIKAIYDVNAKRSNTSSTYWGSLDLHAENLGVDQHGNFVFFDF